MMEIKLKLMIVLVVGFPPVEMDLSRLLGKKLKNAMMGTRLMMINALISVSCPAAEIKLSNKENNVMMGIEKMMMPVLMPAIFQNVETILCKKLKMSNATMEIKLMMMSAQTNVHFQFAVTILSRKDNNVMMGTTSKKIVAPMNAKIQIVEMASSK